MPLIGAGDQGWPASQMMEAILKAAISWINRGLQLRLLKIVVRSQAIAESALQQFREMQAQHSALETNQRSEFDLFISYCHKDSHAAETIVRGVQSTRPQARIFCDKSSLRAGASWLMQVAESLDNSKRVAALYTPDYWRSASCKDEFTAALARQNDIGQTVLFPIYYRSAAIPYLFRNLEYIDCRESNGLKLTEACHALGNSL